MTQPTSLRSKSQSGFVIAVAISAALFAGAVGLAVQIVCTRLAVQWFGSSSTTISAMLAMALLGLSLGAWTIGRLADEARSPLRVLGFSFLLCAVFVECLAQFADKTAALIFDLLTMTGDGPIGDARHQIAFALATILPINFLLGGVLPLLTKVVFSEAVNERTVSGRFGLLYASETIGAAAGALVAGFWSIQYLGLQLTLHLSALSIGLGGCIVLWAGFFIVIHSTNANQKIAVSDAKAGYFQRTLLLIVVALAGSASLGMEVIWQRLLVILFGSDTHSYSIVAATFLIGIAIGAVISPMVIRKVANLFRAYGLIIMAIGFSAICISHLLLQGLRESPIGWNHQTLMQRPVILRFVISFGLLIVPTVLIGAGFPIAVQLWIKDFSRSGRDTGQIYGIALFGNVLGVLGCGYLLVPIFGLRMGMLILSGLCIVGGLAILSKTLQRTDRTESNTSSPWWVGTTALCLLIGWGWVSYWAIRNSAPIGVATDNDRWSMDYYHEGPVNTVAVVRDSQDPRVRKMIIDGVSIGESSGGVDEKQQMLAHLPMILRPEIGAQKILTIGLGTGILTGELAENPAVERVTCIELSPSVMEAAKSFSDLNGDIFSNGSVKLVLADGIQFLLRNTVRFDAIVSDAKSRPGHAGNVAFFSREYYELCDSRLTDNGIFVQWVSLETSTLSLGTIVRTFAGAFPHGYIAIAAPGSIYLVGSKRPLMLSESHITRYLKQNYSLSLTRYHWNSFDDFVSMYWLDQTTFSPFVQHAFAINTLDVPALESFSLGSSHLVPAVTEKRNLDWLQSMIEHDGDSDVVENRRNNPRQPIGSDSGQGRKIQHGRMAAQEIIAAEIRILESGDNWLDHSAKHYKTALELLSNLTRQQRIAELYRQLAKNAKQANRIDQEFSALASISELNSSWANDEFRMGQILIEFKKPELALDYFHRATKLDPNNANFRAEFGFCLLSLRKNSQAAQQFRRVISHQSDHALAHLGLGIVMEQLGETVDADRHLKTALKKDLGLRERLIEFQSEINAVE